MVSVPPWEAHLSGSWNHEPLNQSRMGKWLRNDTGAGKLDNKSRPRSINNKLPNFAFFFFSSFAWNIPFMGVYPDVFLWTSIFLYSHHCNLYLYFVFYNMYAIIDARMCLATTKHLDRHPWRVCFEHKYTKYTKLAAVGRWKKIQKLLPIDWTRQSNQCHSPSCSCSYYYKMSKCG